jgi:hypothetical protein
MCCRSLDQIPYTNYRPVCWLSWPRADLILNIISCLRKRLITSNLRQTFLLMRFPLFSMAQSFKKRVYIKWMVLHVLYMVLYGLFWWSYLLKAVVCGRRLRHISWYKGLSCIVITVLKLSFLIFRLLYLTRNFAGDFVVRRNVGTATTSDTPLVAVKDSVNATRWKLMHSLAIVAHLFYFFMS